MVRAEPADQEDLSSVPVRVQVGDLGWTLAGDPEPSEVQVRFAGPAREILRLSRAGASVRIPIESVASADTTVQLRRDWVVLAGVTGLVVQDIVPGSVRLTFEESRQRALPLIVRTEGRLSRELALTQEIGVTPAVVRVRGPAHVLDALESIPVEPLDLSSVRETGMFEVAVDTAGLSGLTLNPTRAQLGVRVEPAAERLMPGVEVEVEGPASAGLEVEPSTLPVTLRGALSRLDAASLEGLRLVVSAESVQDVGVGESRRVAVTAVGLPSLIVAEAGADSVTVRRPAPPGIGSEGVDSLGAAGERVDSIGRGGG